MASIACAIHPDHEDAALPSDLAIRLLETLLPGIGTQHPFIQREAVVARAQTVKAPHIGWWVDQVLGQLCTHGYVERVRGPFGLRGYRASTRWEERDELLRDLRPPRVRGPIRRGARSMRKAV